MLKSRQMRGSYFPQIAQMKSIYNPRALICVACGKRIEVLVLAF
jgi:hypothetical protein